jgi:hypothetical protein
MNPTQLGVRVERDCITAEFSAGNTRSIPRPAEIGSDATVPRACPGNQPVPSFKDIVQSRSPCSGSSPIASTASASSWREVIDRPPASKSNWFPGTMGRPVIVSDDGTLGSSALMTTMPQSVRSAACLSRVDFSSSPSGHSAPKMFGSGPMNALMIWAGSEGARRVRPFSGFATWPTQRCAPRCHPEDRHVAPESRSS